MSTRAIQIESLLTGLVHPTTGLQMTGGTAYFYSAGTSTAKNVWTEKEKTNPFTSYTLSAIGGAQLYGDGEYKIVVKDADAVTCYTWDNVRLRYPNYYSRAVTSTTSQTSDDDFLEVNTTAGAVTINLLAAASWTHPLKVMHTAGANAITLEPSGAELIDSAANYSFTSIGTIVEVVVDAAGTSLRKAGIRSANLDADGDTGIEVERTADVDTIYFKTAGVDRMVINGTATDVDALSIGGTLQTSTATEVNQLHSQGAVAADFAKLHAITSTASELSELHSQGAVAADFAKLHAVTRNSTDINNLVTLAGTENLSHKTFTDGLIVEGGALKVKSTTATIGAITGSSAAETIVQLGAGGYEDPNDTGVVRVYSKDHVGANAGKVRIAGTNGTAEVYGLEVGTDGTVNLPVALQISGVAFAFSYTTVSANGDLTGTIYLSKSGRVVTVAWDSLTHSSAGTASSSAGLIPAAYRPIEIARAVIHASTSNYMTVLYVDTGGTITFTYMDFAASSVSRTSTQSGNCSWVSAS